MSDKEQDPVISFFEILAEHLIKEGWRERLEEAMAQAKIDADKKIKELRNNIKRSER